MGFRGKKDREAGQELQEVEEKGREGGGRRESSEQRDGGSQADGPMEEENKWGGREVEESRPLMVAEEVIGEV